MAICDKHNVTVTPFVSSDGIVHFPDSNGYLYAICATIGYGIWKKNLNERTKSSTTVYSRTTPVITKDLLLVTIYSPAFILAVH
jgi:outer membrane protein assembly factor BamB